MNYYLALFDQYGLVWSGIALLAVTIIVVLWLRTGVVWLANKNRERRRSPESVDAIIAKRDKFDSADRDLGVWTPLLFFGLLGACFVAALPYGITSWLDQAIVAVDFSSALEVTAYIGIWISMLAVAAFAGAVTWIFSAWALASAYDLSITDDEMQDAKRRQAERRAKEREDQRRMQLEAQRAARPRLFGRRKQRTLTQ